MKNKTCVATWVISRMLMVAGVVSVAACARHGGQAMEYTGPVATPTVDYVESLDVYSAPHKDSFLNQLAMNYRSYAIYNARTSGYADMGELFANKAVAAFSGEVPFPESLENWPVENEQEAFELSNAYGELMEQLKNDASYTNPELAAEAQAKFDCWLSASASGQVGTANQCRDRFEKTMTALRDCTGGKIVKKQMPETTVVAAGETVVETQRYYPETRNMSAMSGAGQAREGVIIVNNVNVPEHLINPEPVQPMVFNQNIYGGDKTVTKSSNDNSVKNSNNKLMAVDCPMGGPDCHGAQDAGVTVMIAEKDCPACQACPTCPECQACSGQAEQIPMVGEELVSREEFINMMMAMRAELAAINARLDQIQASAGEKTMIKVQQIPLEPKQHVMEEVFEIRFDFNKAKIKPEYQELIQKLASATQENKNIKVSVVGHTDTAGTSNYNYALGGRRAEAVQKMLIQYGIPASQIVAVSAGEEDLAVPTPDNTPNAANRRVRVVKEVHYTEEQAAAPVAIEVEEVSVSSCGEYGCEQ
ncbi:MAG: OmpA family protein [Alphaproteobacteria bacterium]|nr:OmpA family protein [Alphaproteobacteria bacterium]MBQ8255506.1 OmpA family protein [Alphaproteobacteria bacterium]